MHRGDKMNQGKLTYKFQGPFEIMGITPEGRYELKRVGNSTITKAAKEQLRGWPNDRSFTMDMPNLLERLEHVGALFFCCCLCVIIIIIIGTC